MTSTKTFVPTSEPMLSRPRGGSAPRPQARSAGTAERPSRNESLVDMVRFFQSPNTPSNPSPEPQSERQPHSRTHSQPPPSSPSDTTTALPVAMSPPAVKPKPEPEQEKPFHRRLFQFAQRPKKESSPKSKQEKQQRQIEALTREGFLITTPLPPKERMVQKEAKRSKESLSLSRSLSKTRKDVENVGQPWLQAKVEAPSRPTDTGRRLASLDLGDFSSMVDVAVSLSSEFDDSVPPPYQPTEPASSQNASAVPVSGSSAVSNSAGVARPDSPLTSTDSSYRNASIDELIQPPSNSAESSTGGTSQDTDSISRVTPNTPASVNDSDSLPRPSIDSPKRDPPEKPLSRSVTPSQPALKLFPDVTPPPKSTKPVWRTSVVPRYRTIDNIATSPISSPRTGHTPEAPDEPRKSSDVSVCAPVNEEEPTCSGALAPVEDHSPSAPSEKVLKESVSDDPIPSRPVSLSLGTLKAFPLPAPTRPLPSLPEAERSPSAPPSINTRAIRAMRSGPMSSNLQFSSASLSEDQELESSGASPSLCTLDSRPATALGSIGGGGSMADDEDSLFTPSISEHSKQSSGQSAPRGRASSVRIPRVQEPPASPSSQSAEKAAEGQPLADSPVLGHSNPAMSQGKDTVVKGLQINSQLGRKNLPFGLPSPPPTAALPSAPPPQQAPPPPPSGLRVGQRNYTAPNAALLSSMRSMEALSGPALHRNTSMSRSNSSGSSLRHETFPEPYQQSYSNSRSESPIPSSDEEVCGPSSNTKSSRRIKSQRSQQTRRGYETVDERQMSHARLRYPQPTRPPPPQNHSLHSLDKAPPPQTQYSHRSRESRSSHHVRPAPQVDHYLEDRVANLERQNQILQAALMAALNAGGKNPLLDGLSLNPGISQQPYQHAPFSNQYSGRHASRPDSWVSSSRSSEYSGHETGAYHGRANIKQLDNMIEDIESGWMSDKSSLSGARITHQR
ncbi:uncharacterized protein N7515_002254 [Penicillium bovifimosum]|uniref:Uncharacterized protein n=1 Tax=Penicillium bovifimosum TaxID=126998 RepID=A0A9W9HB78_9EURO|nr:uncharacterized protein N7515_002254 [Penicillium bovifimosum]KAJ5143467.1 hypothetical protein N7515_002254 [Penicillium bovifimosum]